MAVDTKTAAMGILLIGVVALAGWVGFLYATPIIKTKTKTDEETEYIYISPPPEEIVEAGLPDDWSSAPNASSFILNNGTDQFVITMEEILKYVDVGRATTTEDDKVIYEKRISEVYDDVWTITDPVTGIDITGVSLTTILHLWDVNLAGSVDCYSNYDPDEIFVNNISIDIKKATYRSKELSQETIIGIASNKQWLYEASNLAYTGNFCVIGKGMDSALYDLKSINVTSEWTIDVFVQYEGEPFYLNKTLTIDDMDDYLTIQTYSYIDTGFWNYNRTYYGINVSDIVDQFSDATTKNYTLWFGLFDDAYTLPAEPFTTYNWSEVEEHIPNDGIGVIGPRIDYVNGTWKNKTNGVRFPPTNLKMCIVWQDLMHEEYYPTTSGYDGSVANKPWPAPKSVGYPCYQIVVPGLHKMRYYNGISEIYITIHSDSRT
jgi:hypothetical protein